jgi:hypothetical protein
MDKVELAAQIDVKFASHRRVLRELGWEEERINKFLSEARKHLLDKADTIQGNI